MVPHNISLPDAKLHIQKLASHFHKLSEPSLLEIRALKGGRAISRRFDPLNDLAVDSALSYAKGQNLDGYNVYITINPVSATGSPFSAANDNDVIAATHIFLDADEPNVAEKLLEEFELGYDFIVVTGKEPHLRLHLYAALEELQSDLLEWGQLMEQVISSHNCDKTAKNPSRIMRLAGFISYPSENKIRKGYQLELVKLYDKGDHHDFL